MMASSSRGGAGGRGSLHELEATVEHTVEHIHQLQADQRLLESQLHEQNATIDTLQQELEKRDALLGALLDARDTAIRDAQAKTQDLAALAAALEAEKTQRALKERQLHSLSAQHSKDLAELRAQLEHIDSQREGSQRELAEIQRAAAALVAKEQQDMFESRYRALEQKAAMLEQAKVSQARALESSVQALTRQFETAIRDKHLAEQQVVALKVEHQSALLQLHATFSAQVRDISSQLATVRSRQEEMQREALEEVARHEARILEWSQQRAVLEEQRRQLETRQNDTEARFERERSRTLAEHAKTVGALKASLEQALVRETDLQSVLDASQKRQGALKQELSLARDRLNQAFQLVSEGIRKATAAEGKSKSLSLLLAAERERATVTHGVLSSLQAENTQLRLSLGELAEKVQARTRELHQISALVDALLPERRAREVAVAATAITTVEYVPEPEPKSEPKSEPEPEPEPDADADADADVEAIAAACDQNAHERGTERVVQIPVAAADELRAYLDWLENERAKLIAKVRHQKLQTARQKALVAELSSTSNRLRSVLELTEQEKAEVLERLEATALEREALARDNAVLALQLQDLDRTIEEYSQLVQQEDSRDPEASVEGAAGDSHTESQTCKAESASAPCGPDDPPALPGAERPASRGAEIPAERRNSDSGTVSGQMDSASAPSFSMTLIASVDIYAAAVPEHVDEDAVELSLVPPSVESCVNVRPSSGSPTGAEKSVEAEEEAEEEAGATLSKSNSQSLDPSASFSEVFSNAAQSASPLSSISPRSSPASPDPVAPQAAAASISANVSSGQAGTHASTLEASPPPALPALPALLIEKLDLLLRRQAKLQSMLMSLSLKEKLLDEYLGDSLHFAGQASDVAQDWDGFLHSSSDSGVYLLAGCGSEDDSDNNMMR